MTIVIWPSQYRSHMKHNIFLPIILLLAVSAAGCRGHDNSAREAEMHIAETLKSSSPDPTNAVKIRSYVIQGERDLLITATLVGWNSKDGTKRDFMRALAYDNARRFACNDKAIHELLVEGVELTVLYASNDDKDTLGVKVLEQSCDDIRTNPPLHDRLKQHNQEADNTPCTRVGSARKTDTGKNLSVYRCTKSGSTPFPRTVGLRV